MKMAMGAMTTHQFDSPTAYGYLVTLWSTVLLEKPTVTQGVKKFPDFYATRMLITMFTKASSWTLS
jgi:hypothetical protein